ncbi:MAG: L-2-amino-thiazoline-4-carboxylic acid hydrolase [Defluviitaleaceae bacterium]|nr:L-2-amino-thiazoline-4-carboxylic acid hydrolase [Defluviitaleaceae bacterium]
MSSKFSQILEWECTEKARILKIMKEHFGEEAYQVFLKAEEEEAHSYYNEKAKELGDNSIEAFVKDTWEASRAQGMEFTIEKSESGVRQIVTKCPLHNIAKQHGTTEQIFYAYCERDRFMVEGFNSDIEFIRTKTLMRGDDCCDTCLRYKKSNNLSQTKSRQ